MSFKSIVTLVLAMTTLSACSPSGGSNSGELPISTPESFDIIPVGKTIAQESYRVEVAGIYTYTDSFFTTRSDGNRHVTKSQEDFATVYLPVKPWDDRYVLKDVTQTPKPRISFLIEHGSLETGQSVKVDYKCQATGELPHRKALVDCVWYLNKERKAVLPELYVCSKKYPSAINCREMVDNPEIKPRYNKPDPSRSDECWTTYPLIRCSFYDL